MQHVGLIVKASPDACAKADEFESWLQHRNVAVVRRESRIPEPLSQWQPDQDTCPDLACVFVLGGDGTFLSAVRWIGDRAIPILGVKFGEVGFLAEASEENLFAIAENILSDRFDTCTRMRLSVKVLRSGREIAREAVLNDLVINRGALARLADIQTYIDDYYLTTYRADGLIVATPTGSTAYSLAAGGPVIHPDVPGIIVTPICPFTLTNRPLILPDSVAIKVVLEKEAQNVMLTFDGQAGFEISPRDMIIIEKCPIPVHLITVPNQYYFDVLKAKLRWSGGRI